MKPKNNLSFFSGNGVSLKQVLHTRLSIVALLVLLALFSSPLNSFTRAQDDTTSPDRALAKWTFMVYLDADNNLENFGIQDFAEMASIGSDASVNILVQFDRIGGYDASNGNWTDTRRFRVTKNMLPTAANGTSIGEANMGSVQTLINFVQWGKANYPASNYAVILWDHGDGWRAASAERIRTKGVAYDDSQGDYLSSPELLTAMATLSNNGTDPIDLVGFDACLMGMIEVDRQLIPYVNVRVASEETIPGLGWPYNTILSDLVGTPTMSAAQLGTTIANRYYGYYGGEELAAVNLGSAYSTLISAVNNFATVLINEGGGYRTSITTARNYSQEYFDPTYIDLYDFAYEVKLRVNNSTIDAAATAVMNAVSAAVIHERHGVSLPGSHGISIFFPTSEFEYDPIYDGRENWLQFTVDTQWDEWLNAYFAPPVVIPPPTLVLPANGALTRDNTPGFRWDPVSGATQYQIQIDNNSNFGSPEFSVTRTGTTYGVPSALGNTTYYWRVRAGTGSGWSNWSTSRSFTVDTIAPGRPTLSYPANGATVYNSPTLQWNAVETATVYQIQVDSVPTFAHPISKGTSASTSFPSNLVHGALYYWHVRARDAAGNWGAWSPRWSFNYTTPDTLTAAPPIIMPGQPNVIAATPIGTPTPTQKPVDVIIETPTALPTQVPGPVLQVVESDAPFVLQTGSWTTYDSTEASGGRYIYNSGSLEDALTLGFYGTQVEIVYVQHPALGIFALEIDGVVIQTISSVAGEAMFNMRTGVTGLSNGLHTLRVYPTNGVMAIDAFVVEQPVQLVLPTVVPTYIPTETPVPTETLVPPTDVLPTDIPTETPVPPTDVPADTPVPPTDVPTETAVPPTDVPTETPVPPTGVPTETPVPPTDVPTEVPEEQPGA